ncbi:MAG TPA: beta-L-arabinofuranosidase domain-containing protein [Phycisphaerae bacterium]|jgi:hypothetical protein
MTMDRRDFLALYASLAGSLLLQRSSLAMAQTTSTPATDDIAPPGDLKVKYFGRLRELPVGAVLPRGWLKNWIDRQIAGLTGHPENLAYPYDTCMFAGTPPDPEVKQPQFWWRFEQSAYFVDGAVRTGLLTSDPAAHKIPAANIAYILTHSGPQKIGESTFGWPNAVVGRALMAHYSATGDVNTIKVLTTNLLGSRIGPSRDGFVAEEAFYCYGLTGDQRLLDLAKGCYDRFFLSDTRSFSHTSKIEAAAPLREHGVTAAEQLKLAPLTYCYTGDAQALKLAKTAYKKIEDDSLMPDGGMVSSENLGTTAFNSLHETCDLTDWSWGMGYMLMAEGEGHWADLIERTIFNALPGVVTKDFKQLQYFSCANQVLASSTCCPRIAMTRMSYRSAHETPCCSGNVNRAMPNYIIRMWMRTEDGLAAALHGPSEVKTAINGKAITITAETDYPFRDSINYTLKLAAPVTFTLYLRIPEWCTKPEITVNGKVESIEAAAGAFAALKREFEDGDRVTLRLPMRVALRNWFGGKAVSVQRGPLVYSLKIEEKRVESMKEPDAIRRVLKGNNVQGFPAVEFFPQSNWRVGIDTAAKAALAQIKVIESPMTDNPFLADKSPVRLEMPVRRLPQWAANWKPIADPPPTNLAQSPQNPSALPTDAELAAAGTAETVSFVPYGSTHLRLTTLPVIP